MTHGTVLERDYWERRVNSGLPSVDCAIDRNAAITARYARWFLQHPTWFRWAGMAAFASHRVGLALLPYRLSIGKDYADNSSEARDNPTELRGPRRDLDLLRTTNNRVYADIAWAHEAFAHPHGGLAAVEAGCDDDPNATGLLDGFRAIERGRQRRTAGASDFWEGNRILLKHEQEVIVQSAFDTLSRLGKVALSTFTTLDFDGNHKRIEPETYSSFTAHMWTRGAWILLYQRSLPDIRNLTQRWHWIENTVLPRWRRACETDAMLTTKLEALQRQG